MQILIVDDSKAIRMIVIRHLRQAGFEDHKYVEASNGQDALAIIEASSPDLILSDWNMPEMNGFELLTELNTLEKTIPFGFVTSESTDEMRAKAKDAGALFLIMKPFTVEAFQKQLEGVIK